MLGILIRLAVVVAVPAALLGLLAWGDAIDDWINRHRVVEFSMRAIGTVMAIAGISFVVLAFAFGIWSVGSWIVTGQW